MPDREDPRAGFLIVPTYAKAYQAYKWRCPEGEAIYSIPREGVRPEEMPRQYRGLDRYPLEPWSAEMLLNWKPSKLSLIPAREDEAAKLLYELESQYRAGRDFIFSKRDALEVYSAIRYKSDWEVIWACVADHHCEPPERAKLMGFEPTWFWGDHFSALSDCMVFPKWHGTDESGTLFATHHDRLNRHALFDSAQDAAEFLAHYRSLDWTESGEYVIAGIWLVEHSGT